MTSVKGTKYFVTTFIVAVLLFLVGLFGGALMLSFSEAVTGRTIVSSSPGQAGAMRVSLGLLLGLCAINGMAFLWAYSKKQVVSSPMVIYSFGLLISLFGAFIGILFNLFEIRRFPDFGMESGLSLGLISYFKWGVGGLVIIWVVVGLLLLWFCRDEKR